MFPLNKHIKNERGLTLVELLASLVLLSILSVFVFSIITKTIEHNRVIQQETMLRDEADIIVSKLMKALYSTKQSHIIRNVTNGKGDSYIEVTNDLKKCQKNEEGVLVTATACNATLQPIGFKTSSNITKLYILDEVYSITYPDINILPSSSIEGNPESTNLYKVAVTLQSTYRRGNKEILKQQTFINEIQPILISK